MTKVEIEERHAKVMEHLAAGLSKSETGRRVGLSPTAVSMIERKHERRRQRIRPDAGPDDPLDWHDLSVRTRNCIRYGIAADGDPEPTLRDVTKFTATQILWLPNMGKVSLAELRAYMAKLGLAFAAEATPSIPAPELVQYEIKDSEGRALRWGTGRLVRLGDGRMQIVDLPEDKFQFEVVMSGARR